MSVIANGFKFGNISINKDYAMTRAEMLALGDAESFPDIFPIWCTDENALYIYYKDTDGTPNVINFNNLTSTGTQTILFPIVDPNTNIISWEIRELTDAIPPSVELKATPGPEGKSVYQVWLDAGNDGSEQDFIDSLTPDFDNLSEEKINQLKSILGITGLETALENMSAILDDLLADDISSI